MQPLTNASLTAALRSATSEQLDQLEPLTGKLRRPLTDDQCDEIARTVLAGTPGLVTGIAVWVAMVSSDVNNSISGSAQFTGTTVQAREIHGGIHVRVESPALPTPRQLLPIPSHFTGRSEELCRLDRMADPAGPVLVVVTGPAGVGKTALGSYWLRGLAAEYPDGQLYADLRGHAPEGPTDPTEVLGGFLRAFGVSPVPSELAEQAALWRSLTARRRLILMLDNAVSAAQVRPLRPGSDGGVVLVTSRLRLTGLALDGADFLPLGLLAPEAGTELLRSRIGTGRIEAEPDSARQVVDRCGGLPLALCVAAARLAARQAQAISVTAAALGRDTDRLGTLRIGDEDAVQGALDASRRLLSPAARRLYGLLGRLPFAEFGRELATAVGGSAAEADDALEELTEVHLLEETGRERLKFHDLVRLHARGTDPGGVDAVRRAVDWYLAVATAAETLISPNHRSMARSYAEQLPRPVPFGDEPGALAWLDAEQFQLMTALRTAAEADWHPTVWQLADAMWPLFLRLRPYALWIEAHERGLAAARAAADPAAEARMLTSGAAGLRNAGRLVEAAEWYRQALALAERSGDPRSGSQARNGLGQLARLAGRPAEAVGHFEQAVALREGIGHDRGAAVFRISLAEARLALDEHPEAVRLLELARAQLLAVPDRYEAARALALLGRANGTVDPELAERHLRAAIDEFRACGSRHWEARCHELLGELAGSTGDPAEQRARYEHALELYRAVRAPDVDRLTERLVELSARRVSD
ncbi:tetratricopeptide repeat protein [Kitasatospora gansuensis]